MVLEYRHLLKGNKITMKNASKTMFNIGNIFTIIYIGLGALLLLIGIIACIVGGIGLAGANGDSQAEE